MFWVHRVDATGSGFFSQPPKPMKMFSPKTLCSIVLFAEISLVAPAAAQPTATSQIVTAAESFLSTLDAKERQDVLFAFNDEKQRARWSNLPVGMVPRAGISMGQMTPEQRSAVMALLSSALSKSGLVKVQQIMEGDEILKDGTATTSPAVAPNGRRLTADLFGKDLYFISILGTPSETAPWMLQFGGHHLALNITIDGERGVLTPSLVGVQPALYTKAGKTVRPLGPESDKALALLNSLDDAQRKQAILGYKLADLVLGPGQDGKVIQPEGLKASAMNDAERAALLDLVSEWAGIIHESAAAARMAQLRADVNETWFAWSGPTTCDPGKSITAYYRIQGPHLVIEYAPQRLGGDPSMHLHTMYRDPTNDYGRAQGSNGP
jgi:hypothetical protein